MAFFSPKFKDLNTYGSLTATEADVSSRLIWLALAALSFIVLAYRRSLALRVIKTSWPLWILMSISTVSILWSSQPQIAFIRLAQQYILIFCAVACAVGILNKSSLINSILVAITAVIIFDFILLLMGVGWTGIGFAGFHGHKNSAGLIFAVAALAFYSAIIYKRGRCKKFFIALIIPTVVLLYYSGSKTSMFLSLGLIALHLSIYIPRKVEAKNVVRYSLIGVLVTFLLTTTVIFNYLQEAGITFTGRLDIWQFIFDKLKSNWLLGYGYSSFWAVGDSSLNVIYGDYYSGFIAQLNQAHNSYLDILLTLGVFGLIFSWIFLHSLAGKFERYHKRAGADISVCIFSLMLSFSFCHSLMESTILRGYNPVWMFMLVMYFFFGAQLQIERGNIKKWGSSHLRV